MGLIRELDLRQEVGIVMLRVFVSVVVELRELCARHGVARETNMAGESRVQD